MKRDIEMAGLPGTGLGGIFYILFLLWIAVLEVWVTVFKKRDRIEGRWREIVSLGGIAGAIVAALYLEGILLQKAQAALTALVDLNGGMWNGTKALELLIPAFAASPFILLMLILAGVYALARILPAPEEPRADAASAE